MYLGLTLIVIGQSGIKPNLSAFVGDQFTQKQAGLLDRVYSLFYIAINVGSAASQIVTPWLLAGCAFGAIQLCARSATAWAFGVPGLLMALALVIYLAGRKHYVKVPPAGRNAHGFSAVLGTQLARGEAAAREQGLLTAPTLVYLANGIREWSRSMPYSVVAALDPGQAAPLGRSCRPARAG